MGISPPGAGNIFVKTKPVVIPFFTKLDVCLLNGCVESDHCQVGFDEDITCAGVGIPIVGVFTRGLIIGTFLKF